jgi:hypothetical protein
MSIVAFKKKSVINYGSKRSGIQPGGYWLPRGPFGHSTTNLQIAIDNYGEVGFSLNGGHRNVGYVGKDSKFSKNGTPFRGIHGYGSGGTFGAYPVTQPVFNVNRVIVQGTQYLYIKPSTLSTKGMLETKYRWINNGKYPNNWVQPIYTGNQTESSSQELYIHRKSTANICKIDVNNTKTYEGHRIKCGPTLCATSTALFKFNDMSRNAPYTKTLHQPIDSSQYTMYIQRRCANPSPKQKPFPYAVQTGTGILRGGTSVQSVGNACNTSDVFLTPPRWYENSPSGIN